MRWWILVGLAGLVPCACAPRAPRQIAGDGQLVLELGGGSKSLSASLRGLGVELLPPRDVIESPVVPTPDPEAAPATEGTPPGRDDAAWFEVELAARQTLMDLAHKHLGSGLRFKELLDLNGWTEKDARRLRIGQKVKIPKVADKAPGR